jgi:acylglycerol lipase
VAVTPAVRAIHEEGAFRGARGLQIFEQSWKPDAVPIAVVIVSHGFAEHSGRYAYLAHQLVRAGYAVRALDHRGHGRSEGKRTSIVRFSDYTDDLRSVIDVTRRQWPGRSLYLLGHSMGGLIALSLVVSDPSGIDALVVSAPVMSTGDASRVTVAAGKLLSRMAPELGVLRPPLDRISRDPAVVRAYNTDPLVFRTKIRARLGAEILTTIARVDAALPSLSIPLLVMQGSEDGLVDPSCGPHVYERAGSPDKTLKMYDGLWHEIFNEPERDAVIADLVAWLDAQTARRKTNA